jgi:hypothetical protein
MKFIFSTVYRVTQKDLYACPYTLMWAPVVVRQISKRHSSSCHVFINMWGVISSTASMICCLKSATSRTFLLYTTSLINLHAKKSNGVKSGDLGGQAVGPEARLMRTLFSRHFRACVTYDTTVTLQWWQSNSEIFYQLSIYLTVYILNSSHITSC